MPTKLDRDQVSGLNEDLSSLALADSTLESRISIEDSINDDVDQSLESRISYEDSINDSVIVNLNSQINDLRSVVLTLVFGNYLFMYLDHGTFYTSTPTQFSIPVTSIGWEWYLNDSVISDAIYDNYTPTTEGNYKVKVVYYTNLGVKEIISDQIYFTIK